ncbi:MAG: hypothetical protein MT334_01135 [Candidatus Nitrosopumilus limneticus]|nr:hypothetical protein [Candidatus Nitrosopumilus limneticus]MDC4212450.1 hypothetical protein [Candidatus Nitrosopumilus limneticus]MDC4213214.1 hypothetical protein [Candidatus Nitrosopumilus limneticus]MDC4217071.1 hypothetical protein [Candidatus Nitrosopumilus limneticus]MDC4218608.1 hypothetical protein [Candidatus Nitrosopumilus limneticus]
MKRVTRNSFDYRAASAAPKSKFKGFAGEPIITAKTMTIARAMPTRTNRVFIYKISNA